MNEIIGVEPDEIFCIRENLLNPVGFQLLKYLQDPTIRLVILYGGSSSGKSYSVAQILLMLALFEGENYLVMRKVGASINKSIYEDFKVASKQLDIYHEFIFSDSVKRIKCIDTGAKIDFAGLDDPEKIKGISNYKRVFMDEWNEFDEVDFKQIRKRLRGKKGQQIITAFNPIKETHWIKRDVIDLETWHDADMSVSFDGIGVQPELTAVKSMRINSEKHILNPRTKEIETHAPDTVLIQSTYLNNFWVVGSPDGTYGYYDEQCIADFEKDRLHDPDYYNVYALGEWGVIRTGSEFFASFNRGKHCAKCAYNPDLPIHVSVDNNRLPYIAITLWQVDYADGIQLNQIGECPASNPDNTARKAAVLLAKRLRDMGYTDKIYLHGDATTRNGSTIDDEGRSFLDLFISSLQSEGYEVADCIGNKNPSVPMSGEFINAIWDDTMPGLAITIDEDCSVSAEDYLSVQKDANGAILKTKVKNKVTGQTYEEHGHLCFAPDVPVLTKRGEIPICDVMIGDEILTENGWKYVYNSLCTIRKCQYFSLTLNGQNIKCTFDHPIYTNRGFIPAFDLKYGDEIIRNADKKTWKEKLLSSTALDFIATLMGNVRAIGCIITGGLEEMGSSSKNISTAICGNSLTAKSLRAIVFIILMGITTIIHLIISPLCAVMSMRNSIRNFMESRLGVRLKEALMKIAQRLPNGINRQKVENGTGKIAGSSGKTSRCVNMFVKSAAKHLKAIASILRNSVLTAAKASGGSNQDWTMRSVLARFVGLNLLSINTLRRSAVQGHVLLNIGGISDLYDISTTSQTFFANGILVHNCDTFRYVVCDVMSEEFLKFSNRRKRNLYAKDGYIHFYNPDTKCEYTDRVAYCTPNASGKFVMVHGGKCGDKWHILSVAFTETASTDDIRQRIAQTDCDNIVMECSAAYYPFVRELREKGMQIKVRREETDIDRRIDATSDYVRTTILFNESAMSESDEYSAFMTSLMDYNKDSRSKEASAVLSGFIQYVEKSF